VKSHLLRSIAAGLRQTSSRTNAIPQSDSTAESAAKEHRKVPLPAVFVAFRRVVIDFVVWSGIVSRYEV